MGAEIGKALVNPISECCQDWAKYVFNDSECTSNCPCCSCTYQTHATPLEEIDETIKDDHGE